MRTPVAFVDANVLFSKTLCDWLFQLRIHTKGNMFALVTSEDAITEALHSLRKSKPHADGQFTARRGVLIRTALDDIVDDFPGTPDFPGADKHDSHIHAATLATNAQYLIADDAGFSDIDPDLLPYEVHTADSFFMLVAANAAAAVDKVIMAQVAHFQKMPGSKRLDVALEDAGCPMFAECVRQHLQRLAAGEATSGIADDLLLEEATK